MSNEAQNSSATEPLILAIETATRAGSVSVARGDAILASRSGDAAASHSTDLIENIDAVLAEAHVQLAEVELFAAAIGPGSFTGLRIGLATAKSLAVSLDRKCSAVPTLQAIAYASLPAEHIVALLPAGRGEVFAQMFFAQNATVTSFDEPAHISPQSLLAKYGGYAQLTWAGEGAHAQVELLRTAAREKGITLEVDHDGSHLNGWSLAPPVPNLAEAIARLAFRQWRRGNLVEPEDLRANYVRASDAELKSHA